jgi:hypothetical protein
MDISLESNTLVDSLIGAHAKLRIAFSGIRFDSRPPRERLFLVTFLLIYSNIASWCVLFKLGQYSQAKVILRTIIESYADLINLRNRTSYGERLQYSLALNEFKILKRLIAMRNSVDEAGMARLAFLQNNIDAAKKNGVSKLLVKEKFELADLLDYYDGAYSHWSSYAHNDCTGALFDCDRTDVAVVDIHHYRRTNHDMNFAQVSVACDVLVTSAHLMGVFIGGYEESVYGMFCADSELIRAHLAEVLISTTAKDNTRKAD